MTNYYKKGNRLLWFLIFSLWSIFSFSQQSYFKKGVKQGSVKVKFSGQLTQTLRTMKVREGKNLLTGIQAFDNVSAKVGARKMRRLFPENPNPRLEAKLRKHKLDLWYVVEIDANLDPKDAVLLYKGSTAIQSAEAEHQKVLSNYSFKPVSAQNTSKSASYFNDPKLNDQWHYNNTGQSGYLNGSDVNLFKAWDVVTGDNKVIISIHDQGVDILHPDLEANIWTNVAELNGVFGVDDDGNGYRDDIHGWNFDRNNGNIDPEPHGTHVAGTIAAVNNNGIGVCGIAGGSGKNDGARVMSLQTLGGGSIDETYIYAANNGAVISQNSWGYTTPDSYEQSVKEAIDYFIAEAGDYANSPMKGGIVIFAAGNSDSDENWYPGHFENILTVSSIGPNWKKASYSNFGAWVDIAAPGGETNLGAINGVLSTLPKNQYGYYQGTSMACPHVSGIAALALANRLNQITPEELRSKLVTGVVDIDTENPDYKGKLGSGHIDAFLAIKNNGGLAPNAIKDFTLTGIAQEFANFTWTVPNDIDDANPLEFRLCYSTSPITKSNLLEASYVVLKNTALPGETMTSSVSGLFGLTHYYFTIVSSDRWNNISDLSNIVEATTNNGPDIAVDENSKDIVIDVDANTSFKGLHEMTILNKDQGVLRWEFSSRHKDASISYDFTNKIKYPITKAAKVASSGKVGLLKSNIFTSANKATVEPFSFSPQSKRYADYVDYFIGETDVKYSNSAATKFYVNEAEGFNLTQIQTYFNADPALGNVVVEVYKGTEITKQNLIHAQEYTTYSASPNSAYITLEEQLYFEQGETFWVVFHVPSGNLYPLSIGAERTPEGSSNCMISFDLGKTWGSLESSLNTKDYAWYTIARSQNKYLGQYLTLNPTSGEINGNSSEKTVLSADGSALINGTYHANAILKSNDANKRELRVPVTLNVTGQQPILKSIETLDFSNVFQGTTKELDCVIKNIGLGNLKEMSLSVSNPNFQIMGWSPDAILADSEIRLKIKYTPNAAGNDNGVITVTSNSSPVSLKIYLFGVSMEPSKIVADPMSQTIENVTLKNQVTATVTVENQGKAALKYFIPKYDKSGISETWTGGYHKYGYTFRTNTTKESNPLEYQFQDISSSGTDITDYFKADAGRFYPLEMGFDFPYYADKMKTLYISHNGFTAFDDEVRPINLPFLQGAPWTPNGYISPLGAFVELSFGGAIHYKVEANRVIVQYSKVSDGYEGTLTAQMVLYADGNIRFYYDDISYPEADLRNLNILIEDLAQQDGILVHDYEKRRAIYSGLALGFDYPGPDVITSISNAGGILLPGESAKMEVVMETSTLNEGKINRYLNVISNDPYANQINPLIQINIVDGGTKELTFSHSEINFGNVFQGAVASRKFAIKNSGTAIVTFTGFELENNKFQIIGNTTATLAPGLSEVFDIIMPTDQVADFNDVLTVTDNKGGSNKITLFGKVTEAPAISVTDLDEITKELNHGETAKYPLRIENNGKADLEVVATGNNWLTMSVPVSTSNAIPDFTYSYDTFNDGTNYQWIDIRKTGTQLPFAEDIFEMDQYWEKLTLPRSINFYGKEYTEIYVGNSGVLTFDQPDEVQVFNQPIPTTKLKTLIAPYWTFSSFNTTQYSKEDVGIFYYADEDKMIISWEYFTNFFGGIGSPISAQVIFYKNGSMKFQYKLNGDNDMTTFLSAIGLQNGDRSDFVPISNFSNVNHGQGLAYVINPAKKHVIPVGTTLSAQIDIDARNIYAGEYKGVLKLRTNVPNKGLLEKSINLTVNGASVLTVSIPEINYGEIMAYGTASYTKEFDVVNSGSKTLQFSNISLKSGATDYIIERYTFIPSFFGGYWKWVNIEDFWGDYPSILPGDRSEFRITYTPTVGGLVNDHIVIDSNATVPQTMIPITANVALAPVLAVQTKVVNSTVNYFTDKDTQLAVFDNSNGAGTMKFEASIDYLRKSIAGVNSRTESISKGVKTTNEDHLLVSIPTPKRSVMASSVNSSPSFNRVLAHENAIVSDRFFGFNGSVSFTTATRFNGGKEGFNLSHFQTYFDGSKKPTGTISYEIRAGGSSVADATIIEQGDVDYVYDGDNLGKWVTLPIKEPKGIYPNEDFYIIITYPLELARVQGSIKGIEDSPGRYMYLNGGDWYDLQGAKAYPGNGFLVRAGEEKYIANSWVSIDGISNGVVAPGGKSEVKLNFIGANGVRGDQHAVLKIRTNDPVNPMGQVPVKLHINVAPTFFNVPEVVTVVSESKSVTVNVGLKDLEQNSIAVKPINVPSWVTFEKIGQEMVIKLAPDYETAGDYTFKFTAVDEFGASSEMDLKVQVLKTNRAPVAIDSKEILYAKLNYFDVRQFKNYFTDPDSDILTFSASVGNKNSISVAVDQDLGQYVIATHAAGETMLTLKATDIHGLSVEQQVKVIVVNNHAPNALDAQAIVYNRLLETKSYSLDKYFADSDGDVLTFQATMVDPTIATVTLSGKSFNVESLANGETEIVLTATDSYGASVEQHVTVIVKQSEITELNIFPNPVVNTLNIKWEYRWAGDVEVDVVALNGTTVRKFEIKEVQFKPYSEIDLSNLPSGVYFLHVKGKEGLSSVIKFVKRNI
ncbi:S8 family serine peptidase [Flavobacterium sp. TSSA_36]|uniref:S8 family serine peptidase n=1 Tax=Flavobacterium sp. TSSA_36 TaxID=3447669 RepID=UPI003F31A8FA